MLRNDEVFWSPSETRNAALLSWGGSDGAFEVLWEHTQRRWAWIRKCIASTGTPYPSGRIVEFGSGMGLLDDILDEATTSIVMLDHTDAYIEQRLHPLSPRCRHILWSAEGLATLQAEPATYDWVLSIAVFYHVDDATAVALIRELSAVLKPGGFVLIEGWNPALPELVRDLGSRKRLFDVYPNYPLDVPLVVEALAPEFEVLCTEDILLLRKRVG